MTHAASIESRLNALHDWSLLNALAEWPTVRQQAKQMIRVARKTSLSKQARFVMASTAIDLVVRLHLEGQDVRWLLRFAEGTRERLLSGTKK